MASSDSSQLRPMSAVPPWPPSLPLLAAATVPWPPFSVYAALFDDASLAPAALAARLHAAHGDCGVSATPWCASSSRCSSRTLRFTAPVKAPSALFISVPKHASCTRLETLSWLPDNGFVVDAVQANGGVPYGDCFTVLTRWECRPEGTGTALRFGCAVEFRAPVLLRRVIERATLAQTREAASDLLTALALETKSVEKHATRMWRLDVPATASRAAQLGAGAAGGAFAAGLAVALLARGRRPPRKPPAASLRRRRVQMPQRWCCA